MQDIIVGSLGGLAIRQVKKMILGPAVDPQVFLSLSLSCKLSVQSAITTLLSLKKAGSPQGERGEGVRGGGLQLDGE